MIHHVQQYRQPPLTLDHWTPKRQRHMALEIYVLDIDTHKIVVGLNWLMYNGIFVYILSLYIDLKVPSALI
jgi:hypothetical protein